MQARVLGYVFNPLSIFWCHDAEGVVRHVVAEVHNTYGGRHAYLLPATGDQPAAVKKKLYVSPFNEVDGYYLVRAPRPDAELERVDLAASGAQAGLRRDAARHATARVDRPGPAAPTGGTGGTADGSDVDSHPGHHVVGATGSGGSADTRRRAGEGRSAVTIQITGNASAATDPQRWPAVARVPAGSGQHDHGPHRRRAAPAGRRATLPIRLVYPDGSVIGAADPTLPTMVIHAPKNLARRVGRYGLIGFGESYMAGEWESNDLAGVMTAFANSVADLIPPALQRLRPLAVVRHPRSMYNSLKQARHNIAEHYDLSNELFAEFLDETMTYSSALFETSQPTWARPRRRAAPQDRPTARLGQGGARQSRARNRHGLGRVVHSGGRARCARALDHAVRRTAAHGAAAGGRRGAVRSSAHRAQGLPRGRTVCTTPWCRSR